MSNAARKNRAQRRAAEVVERVENEQDHDVVADAEAELAQIAVEQAEPTETVTEPVPEPAKVDAMAAKVAKMAAKAETKAQELLQKYPHVVGIAEMGDTGPKRVVIRCLEPMTKQGENGQPVSVCEGRREIAVQDLFQVRQCSACADRKVRIARRQRAKIRNKAAKQILRDMRAAKRS